MSHSEKAMVHSEKSQPPPYQEGGPSARVAQFERAGQFEGGSYVVNNGDSSSTLVITLQGNGRFIARIQSMIHMSREIKLDPADEFPLRPKESRDEWMRYMKFSGPGSVTLGLDLLGHIFALPVDSAADKPQWSVRTDTTLAATEGVTGTLIKKDFSLGRLQYQNFGHYMLHGKGIFWLRTYGVVERIELGAGQSRIVGTTYLVAWSRCTISPVKLGARRPSFIEVQGPGIIYIQTCTVENWRGFVAWVAPRKNTTFLM